MTDDEFELVSARLSAAQRVRELEAIVRERDKEIGRLETAIADRDHRIFVLTAECSARGAATTHYRETLEAVRRMSEGVLEELTAVYEDLAASAEDRRKREEFVKTILKTKN